MTKTRYNVTLNRKCFGTLTIFISSKKSIVSEGFN